MIQEKNRSNFQRYLTCDGRGKPFIGFSYRKRKIIDRSSKKLVSEGVLRLIARVEAREKSERANEARDKIKLKQKCLPRHSLYLLNPSLTLCNPDDDYCDESVKLYQRNYLLTGYG